VETMKRLINDLLDVEQMVNGAIMLNLKKCNISELLKEVQFSFGPAILNQNLSLELQPVDETIVAVIDYDRIFQVLSNLIGNAIKFSSRNGVIKIGFEKIDNMISISIHDNGPGIPEDKKDLIFERFTQLNTNDHRGKGLGLFISKWIVESHEGEIFVESSKDKGSTFKITLPILQESTSHLIN
jgi:signal transduction histidine kinase